VSGRPWRWLALVAALGLLVLPVAAGRAQPAQTPQQAEAIHAGMLELRQLERAGDRAGAIRHGEKLLEEFPGNRRVEDALLTLYRQERRDDAVAKLLRERVKRNPEDGESVRELASVLLARGDAGGAQSVLDKLIAGNPKDENRYRLAATLFAARGHAEPAIRFYRAGRDAVGNPSLFAPELAQLERGRGDEAAALSEFLLLAENPDRRLRAQREIGELLDRAADRDALVARIEAVRKQRTKSPAVHDIAASAYLEMGRLSQALDAVQAADREAGDQGEHLLDFGRTALEGAAAAGADAARAQIGVEALQALVKRHPQSNLVAEATKLAAEGLVAVARATDDEDQRNALLRRAVEAIDASGGKLGTPEMENRALALKAMILFEDLGRPQDALGVFEELARRQRALGQPDELLRVQIALCRAALGQLDAARTDLETVVQADSAQPTSPFAGTRRPNRPQEVGWSRARFHLAQLDMVSGRYDEAREAFAGLAEEAPEDRLANDCLDLALLLNEGIDPAVLGIYGDAVQAKLLRDRKRQRTALETLIQKHAASPLAAVAQFELAVVLADEHQMEPALAQFDVVLKQHPKHRLAPRALESIGDLHAQMQHRADAVASYERLLVEYPDDLFLDGVRKKLLAARAAAKEVPHATP
jgi:tetratricopeptide (TPR) repeat protein